MHSSMFTNIFLTSVSTQVPFHCNGSSAAAFVLVEETNVIVIGVSMSEPHIDVFAANFKCLYVSYVVL